MKVDLEELINVYFKEALDELQKIISIKSFRAKEISKNIPYGQGLKDVLDYVINLSKQLGFKTYQDPQNRYGFLEYGPDDGEVFAILCHLDVVPAGNIKEWKNPPFTPIVIKDKLFGRGSFDDKGPTIMNLYALKYLKDHNYIPKKYKIRMIFGLTEETTWESIGHYIKKYGVANNGYVPDGEFPVVYAEKWILDYDLLADFASDFEIKGGEAYNVINDYVVYKGIKSKEIIQWLNKNGVKTEELNNGEIGVKGKSGHGSMPWLGVNAAVYLCKAMTECGIKHPFVNYIATAFYKNHFFSPDFDSIEDETGRLTQNLGIIEIKNNYQRATFNLRIPAFSNPETIVFPKIEKMVKEMGFSAKKISIESCVYISKDSPIIKKMLSVYQQVTGDLKSQPLAIGGGTYAKAMPGLVAFGAEFDINNSTMHAYNEYVLISDLKKMLEIYTKAIFLLTS